MPVNKVRSFFGRLHHSRIPRDSAVLLVALACSTPAFCGQIHVEAKAGNLENVKALLKGNPDLVFSKDTNGCTALHCSAAMDRKDVAALLLASKAEVNAKDKGGWTALHWAVFKDRKQVAALWLIERSQAVKQA